jgi:hypothetical protein
VCQEGKAKSCRLKKIFEFLEKNSPNPLTNGTRCAIIKTLPRENKKNWVATYRKIGE